MRVVCCIVVACFGTGCATRNIPTPIAPMPPFIEAVQKIKHSVIPIVCINLVPTGVNQAEAQVLSVEGTAFFVARDGTFVTANHVIEGTASRARQIPCPQVAFYLPQSGGWTTEQATFVSDFYIFSTSECRRDMNVDIARCKSGRVIAQTHNMAPVMFEDSIQADGTPIAFTGFPLQYKIPISSIGNVSGYAAPGENPGLRVLIMDKTGWPGASGSPIYLINGKVVGMLLLRGTGEGSGTAYGRPSRFIEDFLRETGGRA